MTGDDTAEIGGPLDAQIAALAEAERDALAERPAWDRHPRQDLLGAPPERPCGNCSGAGSVNAGVEFGLVACSHCEAGARARANGAQRGCCDHVATP